MGAPTATNHPTEVWKALLNTAVLGIDRAGVAQFAAEMPWSLHTSDEASEPVQQFLREIATLAIYELAGRTAAPIEDGAVLESCEPDERVCDLSAGRLLNEILHGDRSALLVDWCVAAGGAQFTAPAELLPELLQRALSNDSESLRSAVLAVIGHRGRWLAGQNPEWRPLLATTTAKSMKEQWETGSLPERLIVLRRQRAADPAEARAMVAAVWDHESAADRTALLEQFAEGLSPDDEAWLEERLDDRSKQVRAAAAALLSRLPGSAFSARMIERVHSNVRFVPGGGLLKKKPSTLEVTLPEKPDEAMQRDSLDAKAQRGMGAKAALLSQIVALAPLGAWLSVQADVSNWIDAALRGEWALPLVDGWKSAAITQRDARWAGILLSHVCLTSAKKEDSLNDDWRRAAIAPLVESLSPDEARALAAQALATRENNTPLVNLDELLMACEFAWGEDLSAAVVEFLRSRLQNAAQYDSSLRLLMTRAVRFRLEPSFADKVAALLPAQPENWSDNLIGLVQDVIETIRFRSDLRSAFSN